MIWESIRHISTGLALAAFAIAVTAGLMRTIWTQKLRLIRSAPPRDRARLVELALEFFHVDTAGMSEENRFRLAETQVANRAKRFDSIMRLLLVAMLLATAVALLVLLVPNREGEKVSTLADKIERQWESERRDGFLVEHGAPGVKRRGAKVWYQFFERGLVIYDLGASNAIILNQQTSQWAAYPKPEALVSEHHVDRVDHQLMERLIAQVPPEERSRYRDLILKRLLVGGIGTLVLRENLLDVLGEPVQHERYVSDAVFVGGNVYDLYVGLVNRKADAPDNKLIRCVVVLFRTGLYERHPVRLD